MSDFADITVLRQRQIVGETIDEAAVRDEYDGISITTEADGIEMTYRVPWEIIDHGADYTVTFDINTGGFDEFIEQNTSVND